MTDPFWLDDYTILYSRTRILQFFPTAKMSQTEKLNAMVRFGIYAGLLLFFYRGVITYLYIPLGMLLISKLLHDHNFEGLTGFPPSAVAEDQDDDEVLLKNPVEFRKGSLCVPPTRNNPFMNPSITDIKDDPNRPPACQVSDPDIKDRVNAEYYKNLFRDTNDVFGRDTMARQFITQPSTTYPNNREGFQEFLYGGVNDPGLCRKDPSLCINNDLRQNRAPVGYQDPSKKYLT
jgi:hypothetical protein